jgi:hypothetical protein
MENTFDIHNWQAKHLTKLIKEEIDYDSAGKIQAIINHLIDSERQDVLDVLGEIPEWNELVTQAADM